MVWTVEIIPAAKEKKSKNCQNHWALRVKSKDGKALGIYSTVSGLRMIVLQVFRRKSRRTLQRVIETAHRRLKRERSWSRLRNQKTIVTKLEIFKGIRTNRCRVFTPGIFDRSSPVRGLDPSTSCGANGYHTVHGRSVGKWDGFTIFHDATPFCWSYPYKGPCKFCSDRIVGGRRVSEWNLAWNSLWLVVVDRTSSTRNRFLCS